MKQIKKIGIAIIGLGAIGERLLPYFIDNERIRVVSVYDINLEHSRLIAEKYHVQAVLSVEQLLEDEQVDAVYLAVPPKHHCELALQIIDAGKHILCEKPLAGNVDEANQMVTAIKTTSLIHAMNFPLFHSQVFNKMRSIIESGQIGDVKRLEIVGYFPEWPRFWQVNDWIDTADQGGFVREVFTHYIQLVHHLFGEVVIDYKTAKYPKATQKSECDMMAVGHIDDISVLFSGVTAIGQSEKLGLIVIGTKGVVELLNWNELYLSDKNTRHRIAVKDDRPTQKLITDFCQNIDGEVMPLVGLDMGLDIVKVVENLLSK